MISTDVCGVPEVIHDGTTGLLVPQNDADSLAKAILTMIQDRNSALNMARNGRDLVLREFNQERNHRKIFNLFLNKIDATKN